MPAILKDPFETREFANHPVHGAQILGASIPCWADAVAMVKAAALRLPTVRTVGWDVLMLEPGPALLEGNDNWDKTHFQLGTRTSVGHKVRSLNALSR